MVLRTSKSAPVLMHSLERLGIPLILIIGEQEIQQGIYKVRSLNENKEYEFKKDNLVEGVSNLIAQNPKLLKKEENKEEQIKS